MTRKRFRRFDISLLLALAIGGTGVALQGLSPDDRPGLVWREAYLMGTRATLTVATPDRPAGLRQLERMLRILEEAERDLSTWRDDSLLSRFNRQPLGVPWPLPAQACMLFDTISRWHRETAGAFDPAVPLGLGRLRFEPDPCVATRLSDVQVDSGGFGKGEAIDRITHQLDATMPWMVNLGGHVAVSGAPSHRRWPVALAHPLDRHRTVLELTLAQGSLAVSGGSERDQWVDGVKVGHIIDPRSGRSVVRDSAVAVWHREAIVADMLSTALYVMGEDTGLSWAEERHIAVCYLSPSSSDPRGSEITLTMSDAFRRQLVLP